MSTVRSLSAELTVIHDVALTVIGTPFTLLVIATGPMAANWAEAFVPRTAVNNAAQKNARMALPPSLRKVLLEAPP